MSFELSEAGYLIHHRPYKEHALLLELFTVGRGRVSAVCRMTKKNETSVKARLRTFEPLTFTHIQRKRSELMILKDVQNVDRLAPIPTPAVFCGEYLNELLYYLYRDTDGNPALFSSYINALKVLRQQKSLRKTEEALRSFELQLLEDLGYAPDFISPQGSWPSDALYSYMPDSGFVLTEYAGKRLIRGKDLNELAAGGSLSPEAMRALKNVTARAIAVLLKGKQLKSRELYLNFLKLTA